MPYRRSCLTCVVANTKCRVADEDKSKCVRCSALNLVCEMRKRKPGPKKVQKKKEDRSQDVYLRSTRHIEDTSWAVSSSALQKPPASSQLELPQSPGHLAQSPYTESFEKYSNAVSKTTESFKDASQLLIDECASSKSRATLCTIVDEAASAVNLKIGTAFGSQGPLDKMINNLMKEDKFKGFEEDIITGLLSSIDNIVRDYSDESHGARQYYRGGENETYIDNPLKEWHVVDPRCNLTEGYEWSSIDDCAQTGPTEHRPITAALRQLLKISQGQKLIIPSEMEEITFPQLHMALVNWFIFDILGNKRDLYELEKTKLPGNRLLGSQYLQAMIFGINDFRKGLRMREDVLREIQLRAWHTPQFELARNEDSVLQVDLIERLESFLHPLIKLPPTPAKSPTRLHLIKKTVELWSYLQAVGGELTLIHPTIGDEFDHRLHDDSVPSIGDNFYCTNRKDYDTEGSYTERRKIWWVLRCGFRLEEECDNGTRRSMTIKPVVFA